MSSSPLYKFIINREFTKKQKGYDGDTIKIIDEEEEEAQPKPQVEAQAQPQAQPQAESKTIECKQKSAIKYKRIIIDLNFKEDEKCALCLNEMKNKKVQHTQCGHTFHLNCLEEQFSSEFNNNNKCALCRSPLKKEEEKECYYEMTINSRVFSFNEPEYDMISRLKLLLIRQCNIYNDIYEVLQASLLYEEEQIAYCVIRRRKREMSRMMEVEMNLSYEMKESLLAEWIPTNWSSGQEFANVVYNQQILQKIEDQTTEAQKDEMDLELRVLKNRLIVNTQEIIELLGASVNQIELVAINANAIVNAVAVVQGTNAVAVVQGTNVAAAAAAATKLSYKHPLTLIKKAYRLIEESHTTLISHPVVMNLSDEVASALDELYDNYLEYKKENDDKHMNYLQMLKKRVRLYENGMKNIIKKKYVYDIDLITNNIMTLLSNKRFKEEDIKKLSKRLEEEIKELEKEIELDEVSVAAVSSAVAVSAAAAAAAAVSSAVAVSAAAAVSSAVAVSAVASVVVADDDENEVVADSENEVVDEKKNIVETKNIPVDYSNDEVDSDDNDILDEIYRLLE